MGKEAKGVVDERQKGEAKRPAGGLGFAGISLNEKSDRLMRLAIILKTDAQGSIAAVKHMFQDMQDSKYVNMRWILASPGPITESDIDLASTCPDDQQAMVLGFNSTLSEKVEFYAKKKGVDVKNFKVIYELFNTVKAALSDELEEEELQVEKGSGECLAVFGGRDGNVCGCRVNEGILRTGWLVKAFRKGQLVGEGKIISLRQGPAKVKEVDTNTECGFSIKGWDAWQKGDEVKAYEVTMIKPKLIKEKDKKTR